MKEEIVIFLTIVDKHLQSNQHKNLFFELCHIRAKYVYFLFHFFNHGEKDYLYEQRF